ncbi:hypothetical protein [Stenotrophomonas sp. Marseille-Q4652]|uniref:hypothetical protein n=1 Tax=Stenotrophomonas sp. Marseille-Q4652 TaxID=2866595 RepID=UPI001CE4616F|nr:hypothetical protein [Stenotrophomonas sp. Marseille-Q4652]
MSWKVIRAMMLFSRHRWSAAGSASVPGLATAKVKGSILANAGAKNIYLERRFPDRIERSNEVVLVITP